jgi:hypothetical protein
MPFSYLDRGLIAHKVTEDKRLTDRFAPLQQVVVERKRRRRGCVRRSARPFQRVYTFCPEPVLASFSCVVVLLFLRNLRRTKKREAFLSFGLTWLGVGHAAVAPEVHRLGVLDRVKLLPHRGVICEENGGLFCELSLCLSRAYLGKMIRKTIIV